MKCTLIEKINAKRKVKVRLIKSHNTNVNIVKIFTPEKDSLARHYKTCKLKNKGNNNNAAKIKGNKNIAGHHNSVINNPIYVQLLMFPDGGIKKMTCEELIKIFVSKNNMIESMAKLHCNPDKPQYHNILYPDTKCTYGEVYEDNKWVRKKINEILENLIDAKIDDLNEVLDDMGDFLNKKTRNRIKETIENMDQSKPDARKKLKSYIKPILYNHKDMIIKTRKLTEEQIQEMFRKEQEEAEIAAAEEERRFKLANKKQSKGRPRGKISKVCKVESSDDDSDD